MTLEQIISLTDAECVCGADSIRSDVKFAFASDLMSDVLTLDSSGLLLITGLCNIQTIRTAEMAEVKYILFVRGKRATDEMVALAGENSMVLLETEFSMFHTSGVLFGAGIEPLF